jgi:hypothetical protein
MKIIFNTNGGNVEDDFPADKALSELKLDVMKAANLDLEQAAQYQIAADGAFLDETKTLTDLAVVEDTTLILWRNAGARSGTRTWDRSKE